jgi:SAM-dependent methyltransferase
MSDEPGDLDYGPVTARYYDAAYASLATLGADVDFYRELARESDGPVLELGCGTGRVLLRVAEDGVDCTGLDASAEMLAVLRSRAAAGIALEHADMRAFDLGERRFGLIFSAFRAFQHLLTVDDQLRCLARVRAHLAPGGAFAFDVFNPSPARSALDEEPESEDLRFVQDGEEVVRFARVRRDRASQTLRVTFRYVHQGAGDGGSEDVAFSMRWFHRYELLHLLHRAGFADVQIFGDFDGSPVGPDSPAFVVVAR